MAREGDGRHCWQAHVHAARIHNRTGTYGSPPSLLGRPRATLHRSLARPLPVPWGCTMSAIAHLRAALSHAAFESPHIHTAVDHVMESLDRDLDRTAYEPSSETKESVRELIKALKKGMPGQDTDENEDQDVDRLS